MKRYSSIDVMRAFAAFLVVCIHVPFPGIIGFIITPLSRIAVPLFFMASGFFTWDDKSELIEKKIRKQIMIIIKLIVVSNLIYFIWGLVDNMDSHSIAKYLRDTLSLKSIIKFVVFNESPFASHLWYLSALMYVLIIFYAMCKYNLKKLYYVLIPLLLIIDLCFGKYSKLLFNIEISHIIVRNFIFVGIPYFLLGNIIRDKVEKSICNFNNKKYLLGVIIFSLTTIVEKYILVAKNLNALRDHYISTTMLSLCLFILLVQNKDYLRNSMIERIGKKYSLTIYIIHPIIISIILKLGFMENEKNIYMGSVVVYLLSLTISIIYFKIKQLYIRVCKYQ